MHKIAVCALTRNSERFIDQSIWSVAEADYIIVLDTGSSDTTYSRLENLSLMLPQLMIDQQKMEYFNGQEAEKILQSMVPSDVDIIIRLDIEVEFPSNWRGIIEEDFEKGYTRLSFPTDRNNTSYNCVIKQVKTEEEKYLYEDRLKIKYLYKPQPVKNYKIAVYTICKNEIIEVDDWMKSMWDADYICVLDTGSTDGTYEKLLEYQERNPGKVIIEQKVFNPWRFDYARNESMKLVPPTAEICISTDLDERLTTGWSEKLRAVWHQGCERAYYLYAWSHLPDGSPARTFWYDKVHSNSGMWKFRFPVHEALWHPIYKFADLASYQICRLPADFIMLHHYPKKKDNRTSYLPLLEMRYAENPNDFYTNAYLAHEYKYQKEYQKCIDFINEHTLPHYKEHKIDKIFVANIYMFLGDCYAQLGDSEAATENYKKGIKVDPTYRENYTQLGKIYVMTKQYQQAIQIIQEGLTFSRKHNSWLELDLSWSSEPWDILCAAFYNEGAIHAAQQCAYMAYSLNQGDERLKHNYEGMTRVIEHYEYRPQN